MATPLKQDMRGVNNADGEGAGQTSAQAKPDCGENNRQIVQPLEDVMQVVEVQWRQVMEHADCCYEQCQQQHSYDRLFFHDVNL